MVFYSLAFLVGIVTLTLQSHLLSIAWAWGVFVCALVLVVVFPRLRWLFIFGLGFAWALLHVDHTLSLHLPAGLENQTVIVRGTIVSIPEPKKQALSFVFFVQQLRDSQIALQHPLRVSLSWYRFAPVLQVGDVWQFAVHLKQPRGYWNVGSFDYQAWLFTQGIRATGYVVESNNNYKLGSNYVLHPIDHLREHLATGIATSLAGRPLVGLITALAVGERSAITESQWAVLRGTGTNHLFAIAGLHIGFVTGLVFAVVSFLWRRARRLPLYIPAPQIAAIAALCCAMIYSALAGFALPTQRAVIMLTVFFSATLLRKKLPPWHAWGLALLLVLVWDPLAVLSSSFWLSFGAVALIIFGVSGRVRQAGWWWHWGRMQWVLALGLVPLSLLFFQETSFAGFSANMIAIPWVGFVVLPLSLLGSLVWLVSAKLGTLILLLAEYALELIWPLLTKFSNADWIQWHANILNAWILCSASIAVLLFLAPRGTPARWLGFIWLLPLLLWTPATPHAGQIKFTLLDVGQGLATVIQTQHHVLIYDTGPSFGAGSDAGNEIILPFLQATGIAKISTLIISSGANDHIGGAGSLLTQLPVSQVISSVPTRFNPGLASSCTAGQNWQWDGVNFYMLSNSCVLKITTGANSILLTGDIDHKAEADLIPSAANFLPADIVIAPHYGSANASSLDFIQRVHPRYTLFSVGYNNRYGLPNQEVQQGYLSVGSKLYSTAEEGAITFIIDDKTTIADPITYRIQHWHFWYN